MKKSKTSRSIIRQALPMLALTAGLSTACSDEFEATKKPSVIALAKDNLVIGETMIAYGENIEDVNYQHTMLHFQGIYMNDLNEAEAVDLKLRPLIDGEATYQGKTATQLRIHRIGPFTNPFSKSGRPGKFEGTITAVVQDDNGDIFVDTEPKSFALNIEPSVLITELQPVGAKCSAPALRALQGLAYRIGVKASGLQATKFVYKLNHVNGNENIQEIVHEYNSPVETDILGESESIVFDMIPQDIQSYISVVRVEAYDANGNVVETALPISVHRPLEVVFNGKREMAQTYNPVPVSGCIPGGINTRVEYEESKSESRQKTVSMTISQNWEKAQGNSISTDLLEGISKGQTNRSSLSSSVSEENQVIETSGLEYSEETTNELSASTSNGEAWDFSVSNAVENSQYQSMNMENSNSSSSTTSGGLEVSASIPEVAKVGGKADLGRGVTNGTSAGTASGSSSSSSTERGYSTGGSKDTTRSFGSATTSGKSQSIENSYALGQVSSASTSEETAVSSNRVWNVGSGTSMSQTVAEGEDIARELTVETTNETTVSQGFSGLIPRGKYGIFYRQTTRWVKVAEVLTYNLCGLARHIGELQFNEYTWAPDLAVGLSCEDSVPKSNLPDAECFIPPCGG